MNRESLALAVSTVALVPAVFSASLPPLAECHAAPDSSSARQGHAAAVGLAAAVSVGVGVASGSLAVAGAGLAATAVLALLYARAIEA